MRQSYKRWGGLIDAVAQCDSFEHDRANDPGLASTFALVDRLEADRVQLAECANCGDFMTVAEVLRSSNLTSTEVCRLASPLLDGLWTLVTGFAPTSCYAPLGLSSTDPDSSTSVTVLKPRNAVRLLARLLQPKVYIETIEWLGLLRCPLSKVLAEDQSLLIAAAGAGRSEAVQYLLQHHMTSGTDIAFEQAAANGYQDVAMICWERCKAISHSVYMLAPPQSKQP